MAQLQRMSVLGPAGAGRRVTGVAECHDAAVLQAAHQRGREHLRHQPHAAVNSDLLAVSDRDARRLLAAMLEGEEPEVSQVGDVDARGVDPEDATHP